MVMIKAVFTDIQLTGDFFHQIIKLTTRAVFLNVMALNDILIQT
jgi:hypothetical protein